jgi:predicted MFS family arabinose efflux permease
VTLAAMAVGAPLLAALAVIGSFIPGLVVAGLFGATTGPVLAATFTIRQREAPAGRYAQLAATAASFKTGAYAVGSALTGIAAAAIGVRSALLCAAGIQLAAAVPVLLPKRHPQRDPER